MAKDVAKVVADEEVAEAVEPEVAVPVADEATEDVQDGGFGLPRIKQAATTKVLSKVLPEPIPVFIGKSRVLGFVKSMERYPTEDENGVHINAPGDGETVYVCGFNAAGSKRLSGTYERKDLMIRK